jgi:hypothetical protein
MAAGVPSREEIVHRALAQLGCVSDEELVAFVAREYGVRVEQRFVPVFRASLRAREVLERARAKARNAADVSKADAVSAR